MLDLDFNINCIFSQFCLVIEFFIIDLFTLNRGKSGEKKTKNCKSWNNNKNQNDIRSRVWNCLIKGGSRNKS